MEQNPIFKYIKRWLFFPDRILLVRWSGWFFTYISALAVIVGLRYLFSYPLPSEAIALFYTFSAFVSHIASFCFITWIVLVIPLALLVPMRSILFTFSVIAGSLIITLLLLDTLVFAENRFHIGLLTLTILGWKTWGFGIFYFVILLIFTSLLAKWVLEKFMRKSRIWLGIGIAILEVVLLISTHTIHIFADAKYYTPITRFTTVLPLFYPTTARRYLEQRGYIDIEENRNRNLMSKIDVKEGTLKYPLNTLSFITPDELKNVIIIVIDALRADAITKNQAPHLSNISNSEVVFINHFSGGNSTRMGVFSLFYGLPSTYWQHFEGTQRTPVLINRFQELHYQMGIFSSAKLNRPTSLDRTAFAGIDNLRIQTHSKNQAPYARDSAITVEWIEWLDNRDNDKPFFGFLFYDSPCARSFPHEYDSVMKQFLKTQKNSSFAKYQTAVYYTDSLIEVVYSDLYERDLLDKTVVFITSDHGEEFDDNRLGYTGHGSSYSIFQLKVPLIVHWPGKQPGTIVKRTSHNDITATIFSDVFGCRNPASDFCSGKNLFVNTQWDWLVVGSYYNFAILEEHQITVNYPGGYFELRDNDYRVISNKNLNRKTLSDALSETKRFFKK